MRIHAQDRSLISPVAPACGAGDRCSRTFAQHLRAANRGAESKSSSGILPYAKYLKNLNDQDDLASRSRVGTGTARPRLATYQPTRPGQIDPSADSADGLPMLPRTGETLPVRELVIRETIEAAYSVRNLLSRGAIIDLMG